MSRPIVAALFALAAMVPAVGRSESTYTIAIRGEVRLICRVDLTAGRLHEFCNAGRGYRVYAAPSAELVGATLVVDGVRKVLTGQEVQVSASGQPGDVERAVALEGAVDGGSLSLRIEAI